MKLFTGIFFILSSLLLAAVGYSAEVTLAWDPPLEGIPTGYKIYQGQASNDYNKSVDVGLKLEAIMQGLESGKTYYWAASAYNAEGESGKSNEVLKAIPAVTILPIPTVSTVSNGVETQFFITSGSAIPTRYLIRITEAPADPNVNATSVLHEGTSSPLIITGLTQGKTYNYYARYGIDSLTSLKSEQATVTIPTVINLKAPMTLIIKVTE